KFAMLEIPSNFIRIRFSSEGQSILVISNIVLFTWFLGFSALLTTVLCMSRCVSGHEPLKVQNSDGKSARIFQRNTDQAMAYSIHEKAASLVSLKFTKTIRYEN